MISKALHGLFDFDISAVAFVQHQSASARLHCHRKEVPRHAIWDMDSFDNEGVSSEDSVEYDINNVTEIYRQTHKTPGEI